MAQQLCISCSKIFRAIIFASRDVLACGFCLIRKQTSDDLKLALQKIDALSEKVKVLEEFTNQNEGVTFVPAVYVATFAKPSVSTDPALQPATRVLKKNE